MEKPGASWFDGEFEAAKIELRESLHGYAHGAKKAAQSLETAMRRFVEEDERDRIHVVESSSGHLRVIVDSRKFDGVGIVERQEIVWKFLNEQVKTNQLQGPHLRLCRGVHPLDPEQYLTEYFPRDTSSSAYRGIED